MRTEPLLPTAARMLRAPPISTMLVALAAACGGASPGDSASIDRETFVATFVDLRATGLRGDGILSPEERAQTLARHGVTEEDLIGFAETHGPDLPFMRQMWDDVEVRLDAEAIDTDSASFP